MSRISKAAAASTERPLFAVRNSRIHGRGVFAARKIPAGTRIVEYEGERISGKEAVKRENAKAPDDFHTFFFSLDNGKIIDGGSQGNDARWINHACAPNCEAREEDGHVFIYSLHDIKRGEELNYDYGLTLDGRHTPALKRAYACLCGAENCRGTLLAPKRKKKQA
ncbi:MAG TPA: SET domain-containing protein-lysine N-methyltransferase [Noviherbaspirillum sp.]|uniref:SET domain-containing protein n=1 Tax=Noviherbaspirillum sp. TaxID=1926288 RepID=UPI002B47F71F|nr:SET domain-containing protein-lysine N-methyltransferase [Noviherbaspirillum sp.]HJV87411.1 SET domain-containing protein-lysine N-methyltransferase [Noviherbaspirillum sp.]